MYFMTWMDRQTNREQCSEDSKESSSPITRGREHDGFMKKET